ncbi:hypothetical protein [Nocardioides euryhalodurans]|uniref:TOMM leader peptide-binding protein n=1 Tax=Nocardioides euryhalodurans TaxID=2518370 RepID=A0A4P7GIS2_9ACTN|nr:hypothetical protein [Nocardioides euryhalodurans]QBR91890.1 hypothetical protein EXE57_06080 [Nocardioides euryhalodurans]
MPEHASRAPLRLRPGVRVSRRGAGQLQVGLHADRRLVLPDTDPVRRLLRSLGQGLDPAHVDPESVATVGCLLDRDLLETVDAAVVRRRLRETAGVAVVAEDPVRAAAVRAALAVAGLAPPGPHEPPTMTLLVRTGAEPRRADLDHAVQTDRAHLPVTVVAGRARLGPLVVPGLTACVRCVDEHLTDRDPRHPLVLEQHHDPDPGDVPAPEVLQLALGWAVRDLATWVDGGRPVTWSATVELCDDGPRTHGWRRHPRCGCAWGDLVAG